MILAVAVGDPAALRAPNGALQVLVRGSDGYIHRTAQTAQDTWVIAFRTPAAEPQLWRFAPTTLAAKSSTSATEPGTFQNVPLGG